MAREVTFGQNTKMNYILYEKKNLQANEINDDYQHFVNLGDVYFLTTF